MTNIETGEEAARRFGTLWMIIDLCCCTEMEKAGFSIFVWLHGLGAHYSDAHTPTIFSNAYASTSALKWLREIKSAGKDATQTLHKHKQKKFRHKLIQASIGSQ